MSNCVATVNNSRNSNIDENKSGPKWGKLDT